MQLGVGVAGGSPSVFMDESVVVSAEVGEVVEAVSAAIGPVYEVVDVAAWRDHGAAGEPAGRVADLQRSSLADRDGGGGLGDVEDRAALARHGRARSTTGQSFGGDGRDRDAVDFGAWCDGVGVGEVVVDDDGDLHGGVTGGE